MMYKNGFAIAIKNSNNKVLRESNSTVYLPFYSEYKILLKNTNNRKCSVSINIDGTDILNGYSLMLEAYESKDLERFLLDGVLNKGNKFKFVPKDDGRVQDPSNVENGNIEVKFTLEKEIKLTTITYDYYQQPTKVFSSQRLRSIAGDVTTENYCALNTSHNNFLHISNYTDQQGATVEGTKSDQKFTYGYIGELEKISTILTLKILAPINEFQVSSVLFSHLPNNQTIEKTKKKYCTSCRKRLKYFDNFCSKCGIKQ